MTDTNGNEDDETEYHTTNTLNRASAWTNSQTGSQPWFAWVALFAAHTPWECPPANLIDNVSCSAFLDEEIRYRFIIQALDNKCFGSIHPGVVQFALCDGSVRQISKAINIDTLGRLSERDDGEAIADY